MKGLTIPFFLISLTLFASVAAAVSSPEDDQLTGATYTTMTHAGPSTLPQQNTVGLIIEDFTGGGIIYSKAVGKSQRMSFYLSYSNGIPVHEGIRHNNRLVLFVEESRKIRGGVALDHMHYFKRYPRWGAIGGVGLGYNKSTYAFQALSGGECFGSTCYAFHEGDSFAKANNYFFINSRFGVIYRDKLLWNTRVNLNFIVSTVQLADSNRVTQINVDGVTHKIREASSALVEATIPF